MKSRWITLAFALSCAGFASAESAYAPGEVLVKFKPSGASLASVYNSSIGARTVATIPALGVQRIKLPSGASVAQAVAYYQRLAAVEYATPNHTVYAAATVNDPSYGRQYSGPKMRLNQAWDLTTGNSSVVIAIIDTGVDYNHEDLTGKVIKGHDYVNGDDDPLDDNGHGTHCAGIAAANTNNGKGIAGMGYNAHILAIKTLSAGGSGSSFDSASAMVEATDKGASVISMSLGGAFPNQAQEDAANYAWSKGALVIAAAGNSNVSDKFYPAGFEKVIAVGSTDKNDIKSSFSNFGADWVDVAAPGSDIYSTLPNNQYGDNSGTSMACPNAAGVLSLLISYAGKGNMTNAELRDVLERTCVPVGSWVAKGRVDAFAAVQNAVRPIIEVKGPASAKMFDGSTANGTAASLWTVDSGYYSVSSRLVSQLGGVAGAELAFDYPYAASRYQSAKIVVRGKATKTGTTSTLYIKANDGTFTLLKSVPYTTSDASTTFTLPSNISAYLKDKRITLVMRAVLPIRYGTNSFSMQLNSALMETRTSSRITP